MYTFKNMLAIIFLVIAWHLQSMNTNAPENLIPKKEINKIYLASVANNTQYPARISAHYIIKGCNRCVNIICLHGKTKEICTVNPGLEDSKKYAIPMSIYEKDHDIGALKIENMEHPEQWICLALQKHYDREKGNIENFFRKFLNNSDSDYQSSIPSWQDFNPQDDVRTNVDLEVHGFDFDYVLAKISIRQEKLE